MTLYDNSDKSDSTFFASAELAQNVIKKERNGKPVSFSYSLLLNACTHNSTLDIDYEKITRE